jgi:hypothetical protein
MGPRPNLNPAVRRNNPVHQFVVLHFIASWRTGIRKYVTLLDKIMIPSLPKLSLLNKLVTPHKIGRHKLNMNTLFGL